MGALLLRSQLCFPGFRSLVLSATHTPKRVAEKLLTLFLLKNLVALTFLLDKIILQPLAPSTPCPGDPSGDILSGPGSKFEASGFLLVSQV